MKSLYIAAVVVCAALAFVAGRVSAPSPVYAQRACIEDLKAHGAPESILKPIRDQLASGNDWGAAFAANVSEMRSISRCDASAGLDSFSDAESAAFEDKTSTALGISNSPLPLP